jgi:hypothetical protein
MQTIFLPALCDSEPWSLKLKEKHRLRVLDKGVLRIIFGYEREEVSGGWRDLHTRGLTICTPHQIVLR